SPAALVMMDYTWRLAGVVEEFDRLEWNIRPSHAVSKGAVFRLPTDGKSTAEVRYSGRGADLSLGGKKLGRIDGVTRLITNKSGAPMALLGISDTPQKVTLRLTGHPARSLTITANQRISL
ncbi:MAG: alpha-L-rhamnosidase, partial [Asticcacaulis sp. 32-58-5]